MRLQHRGVTTNKKGCRVEGSPRSAVRPSEKRQGIECRVTQIAADAPRRRDCCSGCFAVGIAFRDASATGPGDQVWVVLSRPLAIVAHVCGDKPGLDRSRVPKVDSRACYFGHRDRAQLTVPRRLPRRRPSVCKASRKRSARLSESLARIHAAGGSETAGSISIAPPWRNSTLPWRSTTLGEMSQLATEAEWQVHLTL